MLSKAMGKLWFVMKYYKFSRKKKNGIYPFSLWIAVYTGKSPVPDIFSTTHQMTVLFITDKAGTKTGFVANFTTGYNLGISGELNIPFLKSFTLIF